MLGTLLHFRLLSGLNAVRARAARLRQPRYLIGAGVAAAYLYYFIIRNLHSAYLGVTAGPGTGGGWPATAQAEVAGWSEALGFAGLVIGGALVWIFPGFGPALRFSQAESAFLLPAPIPERTLMHYKLLASQGAIVVSAVLVGLVGRRMDAGGDCLPLRMGGCWMALSLLHLHSAAVHQAVSRRRICGKGTGALRAGAVVLIVLYASAVAAAVVTAGGPGGPGTDSGLLSWLLLPIRLAFGPVLASGPAPFLRALPGGMLVLGFHYAWIIRTGGPIIEEDSAEGDATRENTASVDAQGAGPEGERAGAATRAAARAGARELFRLAPQGLPEIAFLWKNLLSMRSGMANRRVARALVVVVVGLLLALRPVFAAGGAALHLRRDVVLSAALIAFYTLLAGPQFARQDLRSDLRNADLLKSYPLAGWRIALGELLAPTLLLSCILWVAILSAAMAVAPAEVRGRGAWITPEFRVVAGLCLGAAAPLACLIQLLVPNALMLLFPAWHSASRTRGGGFEGLGQRLVLALAQFLIAAAAFVPAVAAAALFIFASQWILGTSGAALVGTAAALAILGTEAAIGLWFLGWRLEALDLSSDLP